MPGLEEEMSEETKQGLTKKGTLLVSSCKVVRGARANWNNTVCDLCAELGTCARLEKCGGAEISAGAHPGSGCIDMNILSELDSRN